MAPKRGFITNFEHANKDILKKLNAECQKVLGGRKVVRMPRARQRKASRKAA